MSIPIGHNANMAHFYSLSIDKNGFTLIEAMVTVSILSILLMLSASSLQEIFIKNRMRRISDDFTSSIFKARNTAVSKNTCTVMCMSSDATSNAPSCASTGNDWQPGWIVFLNTACDGAINKPADAVDYLEVRVSEHPEYMLNSQASKPTRKILFNPRGSNGLSGADEFDLLYRENTMNPFNEKYAINICVDALGRTRTVPGMRTCSNYK